MAHFLSLFLLSVVSTSRPGALLKSCRLCDQIQHWPQNWDHNVIEKCKNHLENCSGLLHRYNGLASISSFAFQNSVEPGVPNKIDSEKDAEIDAAEGERLTVKLVITLVLIIACILLLIFLRKLLQHKN